MSHSACSAKISAETQTHTTAQTFRGDINGIKDRKQNQRMHFTSRHYLLLSAGKADGDSQNQSGTRFRTAGSDAEHKTGDFLYEEMKRSDFRM